MILLPFDLIFEIDFIGFGLLIALYAIIMDRIDDIRESREKKVKYCNELEEKQKKIVNGLVKDIKNKELKKELTDIEIDINNIMYDDFYHYGQGYFVSSISFIGSIISLFFYSFDIYLPLKLGLFFYLLSQFFLWIGIFNLCYIWLRTLFDFKKIFDDKISTIKEHKINNK